MSRFGYRFRSSLVATLSLVAAAALAAVDAGPIARQKTNLGAAMRHHFEDVYIVHTAVIRGDLDATRAPAARLAKLSAEGADPAGVPYIVQLREHAEALAAATTLEAGAETAAAMVATCGDCHRAIGEMPGLEETELKDVGGVVGHMTEHQHAVDLLLEGLVVPSRSAWARGARGLGKVPLEPDRLPPDSKLTNEVKAAEQLVHDLADAAAAAETRDEQVAVYGRVVSGCAQCHVLHRTIWGPTPQ